MTSISHDANDISSIYDLSHRNVVNQLVNIAGFKISPASVFKIDIISSPAVFL